MRKDAGFEVEDRIVTRFVASDDLRAVFERFGDYIKQETLSVALATDGGTGDGSNGDGVNGDGGHRWTGQIDGAPLSLVVARANGA